MAQEDQVFLLTQEAYDKMQEELKWREGEYRDEIIAKVSAARAEGDLSENGGFHSPPPGPRGHQGRLQGMTVKLRPAQNLSAPPPRQVGGGSLVSPRMKGRAEGVVLGWPGLSIVTHQSITSPESPIGAAIYGAKVGDTVSYKAPNGREISVTIKDSKPLS